MTQTIHEEEKYTGKGSKGYACLMHEHMVFGIFQGPWRRCEWGKGTGYSLCILEALFCRS